MNETRQSDGTVVPKKPSNKGQAMSPAERVEGRDPAKGMRSSKTRPGHSAGTPCKTR
jgi:hypothetical protein